MTESLGRSIAVNKLLRQREGIFATDRCRHSQAVLEQAERAIAELLSGSALRLQVAESE
jgi:hypothetical protein